MDPLELFGVFLKASALSLGGLSSLPLLRADLVAPGIATDDQLVQAIAIGRISTGPNGLYIVSLGYLVGGVVGRRWPSWQHRFRHSSSCRSPLSRAAGFSRRPWPA